FSDSAQILQWYLPPFFSYTDHAPLQLSSNLIVVPLHRGAVDAQISGNSGLVGYIRVPPQISSDGSLFRVTILRILCTRSGAAGGHLHVYLQNQFLQFVLALLLRVGVDVSWTFHPVWPLGG